ncbi:MULTISPECIES: acyl carrier protein [unclassified Streptomyces]|uniref:acyl carrier protein n=1 Tax=unclassified Streptomyces TaxID=2593676 RepID=UPI00278C7137|nr:MULTISPECIES: phosphopantetheine-binding protein [unclassified Streptomyces]
MTRSTNPDARHRSPVTQAVRPALWAWWLGLCPSDSDPLPEKDVAVPDTAHDLGAHLSTAIARRFDLDPARVTPATRLGDLDFDSLSYIELSLVCEEEFHAEVHDDLLHAQLTVTEVASLIRQALTA